MIIKQKRIDKEYIVINDIDINIENNKIYLIDGDNGAGKTTLMEAIVFDTLDVEFDSTEKSDLYNEQRGRLFSYFSQNVVEFPGSVYEFLKKDKKELSKKDVENLLRDYRCDNIKVNDKFTSLSGGEKTKVALISVLSKDVPYIFFDEPTNNLDVDSVEWFVNVLKEVNNKSVILISHDAKVREVADDIISFRSDLICNNTNKKVSKSNYRKDNDSRKAVNYLYKSKYNFVYAMLLIVATVVVVNLLSALEKRIYTKEDLPLKDNILMYIMEENYEELNQNYVKGRKLKVDENNYEKVFPLIKIKELAKKEGVKKIYIRDNSICERFYGVSNEESEIGELIFSIPELMHNNETFITWMSIREISYLKEGRLPKDNSDEVVVSEKILEKYGIEREKAIDSIIEVEGVSYKIVGIGIEDVYLVSYKENENRGIYCYDENSFEAYYSKISDYYTEMEYKGYLYDGIFIEMEEGYEKEVLKSLICEYPATNYYSHDFAYVLNRGFNQKFYTLVIIVTVICAIVYGISLCSVLGGNIKNNANKVLDFVNYYVNIGIKNMYIKRCYKFILFNYLIDFIVALIAIKGKDMEKFTTLAVLCFVFIVQVPTAIVIGKVKKKFMERNINDC